MKAHRRARWMVALVATCLTLAGYGAWSQTRTVKIVVPYTPGSGPDILSRLMAEQISRAQGTAMVVENRPGGGTVIGTEAVARAAPDGNTVLLVANSFVVNPALKKQNYDPSVSFEPICYLAATPIVLVVLGSSPYRTLADLIAAARAKPGELSLASGGPASSLHIAFEVVKRWAGTSRRCSPTIRPWYSSSRPARCAASSPHRRRGRRRCPTCRRLPRPA
jgi:tripartite-type tricarboxylate transporter receptor subunit TctC